MTFPIPPADVPLNDATVGTTGARPARSYRRRWDVALGVWVLGFGVWVLAFALSVASGQGLDWPSETAPRPLPAREVKFPPYEVRTLANGMQIVTVLHHEQPAVTMRLLVRAGAAQDPEKKRGVANLVSSLLDQGTTTRSSEQIADQIDSIGGAMGTGSGADLTSVYAVVMKDSFTVAMDLLADVVRNPAFAPEEIERQKEQAISSQRVNTNDPDYVASVLFARLVYGFHPYGLPGVGTPETLPGITREDLQAFHRVHFVPNNMVLAIVGDVTSEEAFASAERVFGRWPRGEVPPWMAIDPPPSTRRVVIVDKPDSVQTEIRVGQLAIPRKHADYLAWDLAVKILGGEGANRLHRVLRSDRGLTYGASADTQAMKQAGDFVAETDTRTETTGEALRLMVDEFSKLQRQRVSERELADAQAYLSGSFPLTIETPNDIATQVINTVFYELPVAEISTFRERVLAITPDDIQRVAKQYVKPDRLSIVLVGNARAFVNQLRAIGYTDFEVIPIEQLDLMSGTLKRETRRGAATEFGPFESFGSFEPFKRAVLRFSIPDPRSAIPAMRSPIIPAYTETQVNPGAGQRPVTPNAPNTPNDPNAPSAFELLRRVVEMKGGLSALKGVRTVVAEAETTFVIRQEQLPSTTKTYVAYPDKFRVDATVAGAQVVQIYNAGEAWVKDPAGVHDAPPPMRADFAANVRRDTIPLLIEATEGRLNVRALPDEKGRAGSGIKAVKVLEISGIQVAPVRLYIDDQMLIAGQSFSTPGPGGRPTLTEEVFSDYRLVNGVRVPFEAQLLQNGRPILKRALKTVILNSSISETLFARP